MRQSIKEILDELENLVAGRGREDNFFFSRVYSPSSFVLCIDFSPWVGRKLLMNDLFPLAVFRAQVSKDGILGISVSAAMTGDGEVEVYTSNVSHDGLVISFDKWVEWCEKDIARIVRFPFDEYFTGDFSLARLDILTSWILGLSPEQFSRILTAYDLALSNAQSYLEDYNSEKKATLEVPPSLLTTADFEEFQRALRGLPLSSRLHLFDVLAYSGFKPRKSGPRLVSEMTLYPTRRLGIDTNESANILGESGLVVTLADGTGYVNPKYLFSLSAASEYAKGIAPAFREWKSDASDRLFKMQFLTDGSESTPV